MELDPADVERFAKAVVGFQGFIDQLKDNGSSNSNTSTIQVNAGGIGVWIAATCCAVMFAIMASMSLFAVYLFQTQNEKIHVLESGQSKMQDYLNAIYQMAPNLKPKDEKK